MKIDIDSLTETELADLNNRIVERLRFLHQARAHVSMLKFSIGDKVTFRPDGRGDISGVIIRYNKKTVSVLAVDGQKWTISPAYLTASRDGPTASNNAIDIQRK